MKIFLNFTFHLALFYFTESFFYARIKKVGASEASLKSVDGARGKKMSEKNVWPEIERVHFLAGTISAFAKGLSGERRFGAENKQTLQKLADELLASVIAVETEATRKKNTESAAEISMRIENLENMKLSNILQTGMKITDRECRERNAGIDAKILALSSMLRECAPEKSRKSAFL